MSCFATCERKEFLHSLYIKTSVVLLGSSLEELPKLFNTIYSLFLSNKVSMIVPSLVSYTDNLDGVS